MKSSRRQKPTTQGASGAPPLLETGPRSLRALGLGALLLTVGLTATTVRAEEGVGAQATRIVHELEAQTADRAVLGPSLERARHALERAANARRIGDHRHGSELEALALELAQSALDLQREKRAQAKVSETEEKALAAETRVVRARALVEQTAARRGRAAERLRELETEKAKPSVPDAKKVPGAKKAPASTPEPKKAPAPAAKAAKTPGTP